VAKAALIDRTTHPQRNTGTGHPVRGLDPKRSPAAAGQAGPEGTQEKAPTAAWHAATQGKQVECYGLCVNRE